MHAEALATELQSMCHGRPDPESAAARLGLVLRPVVGATYVYNGVSVTYDATLTPREQRKLIARAVVCKLRERAMTTLQRSAIGWLADQAFGLE